jgi:hypothetical protein
VTTARLRVAVGVLAAVTVAALYVQSVVLRPRQWPAGVGMTLSGDSLMLSLAEPAAVTIAQLPDLRAVLGRPITIVDIWPGGEADQAGLKPGAIVTAVEDADGHRVDIGPVVPDDPARALAVWRDLHHLSPVGPLTFDVRDGLGISERRVTLDRPAVWSAESEVWETW